MSDDDPERRVGELIADKYRLQRLLGAGGMGAVYAAEHTFTKRAVAVKLMHESFAKSKVLAERFVREAQAPSTIGHPGIVEVLDGGFDDEGRLYLVLEMLQGQTLSEIDGAMPLPQLLQCCKQLLGALQAAHDAGFIHRDIKPDNVFLVPQSDGSQRVKLLDFGVAGIREAEGDTQLTRTGTVLGTPMFMSPEQAKGARVDHRSDLWAVGAILYDALAGHPPYQGDSYNALIVSIVTREHIPLSHLRPDLPRSLLEVIARALRKEPEDRYQQAQEMIDALEAIPETDAQSGVVSRAPKTAKAAGAAGAARAARAQPPQGAPPANPATRVSRRASGRPSGQPSGQPATSASPPPGGASAQPSDDDARASAAELGLAATRPSAVDPLPAVQVSSPGLRAPRPVAAPAPSPAGSTGLWMGSAAVVLLLAVGSMVWLTMSRGAAAPDAAAPNANAAAMDMGEEDGPRAPDAPGAPGAPDAPEAPAAPGAPGAQPTAIAAPQPADVPGPDTGKPHASDRAAPPAAPADEPLGPSDLSAALSPKQPELQRCYEDSIADSLVAGGPTPAAVRLDVTLTVSASGSVRAVGVRGGASAALVACLRGRLLSARFRRSPERTELVFPVVFQPTVIGR